jgi:hypothetical protein
VHRLQDGAGAQKHHKLSSERHYITLPNCTSTSAQHAKHQKRVIQISRFLIAVPALRCSDSAIGFSKHIGDQTNDADTSSHISRGCRHEKTAAGEEGDGVLP